MNQTQEPVVLEEVAAAVFEGCKKQGLEDCYPKTRPFKRLDEENKRIYRDIAARVMKTLAEIQTPKH